MKIRTALGALLATGLLTVAFAGVASAHDKSYSLTCDEGLQVSLTYYDTKHDNSVSIDIDGANVVDISDFGASYTYSGGALDPYVSHTAHIVVVAWDDLNGSDGYSFDVTLNLEACQQQSSSTTSSESSTTSFTSSVEESSTTSFSSSEESTSAIPTEPNTATIGTSGPSTPSNGLWLLFAGLGVVGGSLLVLVPSKAKGKR